MYKHASINRNYKLVWSDLRRMYVPVPEHQSARPAKSGKRNLITCLAALALAPVMSFAEPTGGVVKAGSAFISSTGAVGAKVTNIKQNNTGLLSLEWGSFNIGVNETVNFVQPSQNSVAFNRILDAQGSQVLGKINATGHVWLVNPNGIFFGNTAQVNVGGLVATTLNTANPQAMGSYSQNFAGSSTATVENQGLINAGFANPAGTGSKAGGYVALVGQSVKNSGRITAATEGGTVALAAGSDINLQLTGNSLIRVTVNQNQLQALAVNGGLMQADGGKVILTAGAANSALASVVNNSGVLQAKSTAMTNGQIMLSSASKDGLLEVSGQLNASASNGVNGGNILSQASVIRVRDGLVVDTRSDTGAWGNWSVVQKNAAQTPADANLSSTISGSTLGSALNNSNVSLYTDKDLRIDTAVAWNAPSKLSLVTQGNIAIDAAVTSTNANGSLSMAYGQSSATGVSAGVVSNYSIHAPVSLMAGNNFSTQLGSTGAVKNFYVITSLGSAGSTSAKDLQGMNGNLSGYYALGSNIDASSTATWNNGLGFKPIGVSSPSGNFTGIFEGLGHTVSGLTVNRPRALYIGLIGSAQNATIKNVTMAGVNIQGNYNVGGLVGTASNSLLDNTHTSGQVAGNANVGGLLGSSLSTQVINSDSTANVTGRDNNGAIGGLVGNMYLGSISNSHATGHVIGLNSVGGLVGNSNSSTVSNSYSLSTVTGVDDPSNVGAKAGGLIGFMTNTTVSGSFADTTVNGFNDMAGGLVGVATNNSKITNSYAIGSAVSNNFTGGLVGSQSIKSVISDSFASTLVIGPNTGGITAISIIGSSVQNTRWDTSKANTGVGFKDPSSTAKISGLMGLSAEQMKHASNFSGFDLGNAWTIYEGNTTPLLRSFMTPLTVKINASQGQTYNADIAYSGEASIANQDVLSKLQGTPNYVLASKNAGTQAVIDNGLYSSQLGYLINFDTSGSQVQIAKASVAVSGITADNKVYDGNQVASMNLSQMQTSGIYAADQGSVSLNIRGTFDTKDVGNNKQVTIAGATGGANGGNYFIAGQTSATANVTPATYTALNGSKTYDGNSQFSNVILTGVNGETFTVANAASNGVNVSNHPQNASTTFLQADGVTEMAGSLGKISNYKPLTLNQLSSNQASVTPADFKSITGTKVYDGNTSYQQVLVTGVNNETFNTNAVANSQNASSNPLNPASQFVSANGGGLVAANGSTGDLRNYKNFNLDTLSVNQAVVTPRPLLLNGISANDKVYDGSTGVVLNTSQALTHTSGVVAGDDVGLKTVTGQFIDKNAGQTKRVDLSQIEFNGASKDNYMAATQQFTTASITPKDLTVSGLKAQDKVYDGKQVAQVDTSKPFAPDSGLVANDDVKVISVTGTFSDKNASPNKTVALSNPVYEGVDKNNYRIIDQSSSSASILQADFTTAMASKTYDGTKDLSTVQITGVNNEVFTASGVTNSKNASRNTVDPGNKLVYVYGVQSLVNDVNNYKPLDVNKLDANTVVIDPALLTYQANKLVVNVNQPIEGLSGSVIGFKPDDSLENSTEGELYWTTSATVESSPGTYDISGGGLTSGNYDFVQHEDNATALTLAELSHTDDGLSDNTNTDGTGDDSYNRVTQQERTPAPGTDDNTDNNTQVVESKPIEPDNSDNSDNNTYVTSTRPVTPVVKDPPNLPTPPAPVVDNKKPNNQDGKTDARPVIPNINNIQNNPVAKIDNAPLMDPHSGKDNLLLSNLEEDYWFSDCLFTPKALNKLIRCATSPANKPRSIEIKNQPTKKLSALNSPLLP